MAHRKDVEDQELQYGELYQAARVAFRRKIERADPANEEEFKEILKFAVEHFNVKAAGLADRLKHGSGTVSKWLNTNSVPPLSTREVALSWIKDQITHQIDESHRAKSKALVPA